MNLLRQQFHKQMLFGSPVGKFQAFWLRGFPRYAFPARTLAFLSAKYSFPLRFYLQRLKLLMVTAKESVAR